MKIIRPILSSPFKHLFQILFNIIVIIEMSISWIARQNVIETQKILLFSFDLCNCRKSCCSKCPEQPQLHTCLHFKTQESLHHLQHFLPFQVQLNLVIGPLCSGTTTTTQSNIPPTQNSRADSINKHVDFAIIFIENVFIKSIILILSTQNSL